MTLASKAVAVAVVAGMSLSCVGIERARAQDQLAQLRESMRLAEMRGLGREARAAEQLRLARGEMQEAETWVGRDGWRAQSLLSRAQADFDLAVALDDEGRAHAEDRRVSHELESRGRGVGP